MKTNNLDSKSLLALIIKKNNMVESIISLRVSPGITSWYHPLAVRLEGAAKRITKRN